MAYPDQNPRIDPIPKTLWALTGAIALIEIILSISDRGYLWPHLREVATFYGAYWEPLLSGNVEPVYALQPVVMHLSYAFLHGGLTHMALNTVILLSIGRQVALMLGPASVIAIFVVSSICGGLAFGLLTDTNTPMVGASGAVFGFFGFWKYTEWLILRHNRLSTKPIWTFVGGLVLLNVVMWVALGGYLAWEAHLGGFIGGWATGVAMRRRR